MDNLKEYIYKTDCFNKEDYYKFSAIYGRECKKWNNIRNG